MPSDATMVADELTCAARSTTELNAAAFTSFRCDCCLQLKRHGHGQHCAARRRCKKCTILTHLGTYNSMSSLSLLRESSSWFDSARRALSNWPGADGRRRHRRSQSVPSCASGKKRYVFPDIHHLGLDPPPKSNILPVRLLGTCPGKSQVVRSEANVRA